MNNSDFLSPSLLGEMSQQMSGSKNEKEKKKRKQKRRRAWRASSKMNLSQFILCLRRMSPNSRPKAKQPNPLVSLPVFLIFTQTYRHPEF